MEKKEAILIFDYIFDEIKPNFIKIIFENKEYKLEEINKKELKIEFNDIESEMCSKVVTMILLYNYGNKDIHTFEVIPGINKGIMFPFSGTTRDIILTENQTYKIEINSEYSFGKKEINISDNRLLLINVDRNYILNINTIILPTKEILSTGDWSMQVYIADLQKKLCFYKNISTPDYSSFFENYENNKNKAKTFFSEILKFFEDKDFNHEKYISLFNKGYFGDSLVIKYNLPKKILSDKYNKKEYFDFISAYGLYYILYYIKEKERQNEIKQIYHYFIGFKKQLEEDPNLENYMRILIIIEFSLLFQKINNFENFKKINFKYYCTKQLEINSPLKISVSFLEKFIENLDENSPFINPLILIDSGNYVYKNENAYGIGLTNKTILKSHLKNIIPDIIISIDDEELLEEADTNKLLGTVTLNLSSNLLSPFKNQELDKKIENKYINTKLSLILFLTLFHEILGHKKGGYSSKDEDILRSPNVFYDRQKKDIFKLVERNSLFTSKNEIKILRDFDEDSGYLLEYFIGECEYGFYTDLIENMIENEVNLNFILNNDLWNNKIEVMRNYIKLKYIIFNYNKTLFKNNYSNIHEEIEALEKIIKENNIKFDTVKESQKKMEEIKLIKSKRKVLFNTDINKQKVYKKYEKLSSKEIREKMNEKEIQPELRDILFHILLDRVRKK